jgi:hypothetical protein
MGDVRRKERSATPNRVGHRGGDIHPPTGGRPGTWLAKLVRHALSLLDALEAAEAERDALAGQLKAVKALRDRVSESVAIAATEGRKLKPVVAVAELDAVLGEEA